MRENTVLSAFLLFLLLTSTHLGNSQESVSHQKLILPDLSGCEIWQAMEEALLTLVLYARDNAERQLLRWKDEPESFHRRGVLVLLVTEQEQSPGIKNCQICPKRLQKHMPDHRVSTVFMPRPPTLPSPNHPGIVLISALYPNQGNTEAIPKRYRSGTEPRKMGAYRNNATCRPLHPHTMRLPTTLSKQQFGTETYMAPARSG